eukprot:COSAG01_NODE_63961_length_278_cov_0.581006_1_plen_71_part_01
MTQLSRRGAGAPAPHRGKESQGQGVPLPCGKARGVVTPVRLAPASVAAEGARPAPGEGDQAGRANPRFHPT